MFQGDGKVKRCLAVALVLVLGLLAAAGASADVRYAAPEGTGSDPCTTRSQPCSLSRAADPSDGSTIQAGDKVVLLPGLYLDAAGDLGGGHVVTIADGVTVEGEPGPFPVRIVLHNATNFWGAFKLTDPGTVLKNVTIENTVAHTDFTIFDGTVERVVATTSAGPGAIACQQYSGTIRDTACVAEGKNATAVGLTASDPIEEEPPTATLVNVTAVASGEGSAGLGYSYVTNTDGTVMGKNVIAQGGAVDVRAAAGQESSATIELERSAFVTTEEHPSSGGVISISSPGENENLEVEPSLAPDRFHQLPSSPTVDSGAAGADAGALDVDGEQRTIGAGIDIGADELGRGTATSVSCVPAALTIDAAGGTTCTATVSDLGPGASPPAGGATFATPSGGNFSSGASCSLAPTGPDASSCSLQYVPISVNGGATSQLIQATYGGDLIHDRSSGSTQMQIGLPELVVPPRLSPSVLVTPAPGVPPETILDRKPAKRTRKHVARFAFSSTADGPVFECRLDGGRFQSCSSPLRLRGLASGKHRFQVRARVAGGLVDSSPAEYRWRVLRR
jgi:hypothetical protein